MATTLTQNHLDDAVAGRKEGYIPFFVVGVIRASLRGEEVAEDRLEEASKVVGAYRKLKRFQQAGGEGYYCPRSKTFTKVTARYVDLIVNGRDRDGKCPSLSDPKVRALFLKGLKEVEARWAEDYKAQSLGEPKVAGTRNRSKSKSRQTVTV